MTSEIRKVHVSCAHDCGGCCIFFAHVKDGVVTRIETDQGEEPQLRGCARGWAYRRKVYAPDRLLHPMKRSGARGEGKFERISWDEALDTVAARMLRIRDAHGCGAILYNGRGGSRGQLHGASTGARLLNLFGGCTTLWGGPSAEANVFASRVTYGTLSTANTRDSLLHAKYIVIWGANPAVSVFGTNTCHYLVQAREKGVEIDVIDPHCSDTAACIGTRWIPIRPETDTALASAMAFVIFTERLHDQAFLDRYTVGFGRYCDYITGKEDGVPKTPRWASGITGIDPETISGLARNYATRKPASFLIGFGAGRTAYGEQWHRAVAVLASMTGNVGKLGGDAAGFGRGPVGSMIGKPLRSPPNPAEQGMRLSGSLDTRLRNTVRVHYSLMWDCLLRGRAGGYPTDARMLWVLGSDPVTQYPNAFKGHKALQQPEFVLVNEIFMTPTARYADILLPVSTPWERNDLVRPWCFGPYYLYLQKAVDPPGEVKSDYDICLALARRLGIGEQTYTENRTEAQWLRFIYEHSPDMQEENVDFDRLEQQGYYKMPLSGPIVAFEKQIADPENHPFRTPSGKIEIYSQQLADLHNPDLPPIPKYMECPEGPGSPLASRYPLQFISRQVKNRAHSNFDNIPLLREIEPQTVWIHTRDAAVRGIAGGDRVRVFNDRGIVSIPAKVTERVMPGVVVMGAGAWFRPDGSGVDQGGCVNTLMPDRISPGGSFAVNACLVEIQKV